MLSLAAACSSGGSVSVRWTGADSGSTRMAGRAVICRRGDPLLIFANAGDTGLALAIYPRDSVTTGEYPVFDPTHGVQKPGAAFAARWVRRLAATDLRGESGRLTLRARGASVSGDFDVHAAGVVAPGQVSLRGTISGLAVQHGGPDCAASPGVN